MILFYLAAAVAVGATAMVITRRHAVHALLYLIVSLLAVAVVFYLLGAAFVAALEVIVYAGAIMVLFIFVVMLLNLGSAEARREASLLKGRMWTGPVFLAVLLIGEVVYLLGSRQNATAGVAVSPADVGRALYGPYLIGVELASFLLLAGLVGAYHLGNRRGEPRSLA